MVLKVRKDMAKAKSNKHARKVDMTKLIKKKPTGSKSKREKNQFQFQGFYDRLKHLDVKQSHSMGNFMQFDSLLDTGNREEMEDQLKSNFISYLKTEKMNNRTLDFKKVFADLEPLAYSHALILLNKRQLVKQLLKHLKPPADGRQLEGALATSDSVTKGKILELIIALIKDLRQDIYGEFVELIMPAVITIIDVQNFPLLDGIFSLFSFSFKFLLKPIRDDIQNFYEVFQELVIHKNRHLRHFAAQSFSYVVRKMQMDVQALELILKPLYTSTAGPFVAVNIQQGVSDVLFEVMYGASQDLHSKSGEVLGQLLGRQSLDAPFVCTVRYLFIKLFQAIDASKQHPLFEAIHKHLLNNGEELTEQAASLALKIIQDAVQFKFGSRVSHLAVIQIMESFNHLMKKQGQARLAGFSSETKQLFALTLSQVYYFKYSSVQQIFQASQIDLASSRTIFTHHIYQVCPDHLESYFNIFAHGAAAVQAEPADLGPQVDFHTLLGQRSGRGASTFTSESHISKLNHLLPSLHKFISKSIQSFESQLAKIQMVSLFNQLASMLSVEPKNRPSMSSAAEDILGGLLQLALQARPDDEEQQLVAYNIVKYTQICQYNRESALGRAISKMEAPKFQKLSLDLGEEIKSNIALDNYGIQPQMFEEQILELLDFENQGFIEDIRYHTATQLNVSIEQVVENPSNVLLLRRFDQQYADTIFSVRDQPGLFRALSQNLRKNCTQLRQQTLVILKRFETLKYVEVKGREVSDRYKDSLCECIQLMEDFEKTEVGFAFEKNKEQQLLRLEVLINSGAMPLEYVWLSYHFLVGCLWIKFAPLFASVHSCVAAIVRSTSGDTRKQLVEKHTTLIRTLSWLAQMKGQENDMLLVLVNQNLNKSRSQASGIAATTYRSDCFISEPFLEIKDMLYQVLHCLSGVLGPCILSQKPLKELLFDRFYEFLDKEYYVLLQKKERAPTPMKANQDRTSYLVDRMTHANMLDSESNKGHRRTARIKLSNFLDVFKRADSLSQVPKLAEFQSLLLGLLNTHDVKEQTCVLECLVKTGYQRGLMSKYKKLLEGFSDDEKFKDMIQMLIHGSQTMSGGADVPEEYQKDSEDKVVQRSKRKETKSVIPKLEDEDRSAMLPVIIKLLQSKLLQKKGAINKKNLYTRRNIVYQFFASLNPSTEFPLFFDELLDPVNLSLVCSDVDEIQDKLSSVSFNGYVTFINSLEVVFKQVGTLLIGNLPILAKIIVEGVIRLAKIFMKQVKSAQADEEEKESQDEQSEDSDQSQEEEQLHRNASKQAKDCLRKGMGLIKDIYKRFSQHQDFIQEFSASVYREVVSDQLEGLKQNFVSEKSQLLEVLCQSWPEHLNTLENFEKYPGVIPAIMNMLPHKSITPEVVSLHMSLLKKLILGTMELPEEEARSREAVSRRRMLNEEDRQLLDDNSMGQPSDTDEDQAMEDANIIAEGKERRQETSTRILRDNIETISRNLHLFWTNHAYELKRVIASRGSSRSTRPGQAGRGQRNAATQVAVDREARASIKKFHTAKDLLFILSEMSTYLIQDSLVNQDFLDMIVDVLSIRNIHNGYSSNEELLTFGVQSITKLIPKIKEGELKAGLLDKIMRLFLVVKSVKVRCQLAMGMTSAMNALKGSNVQAMFSESTLAVLCELNKVRRGIADMEVDCDRSIRAIQDFIQGGHSNSMTCLELSAVTYSVVYLCQHEEYSMREYAEHALNHIFTCLKTLKEDSTNLIKLLEQQLVGVYLVTVSEEMVLKTVLKCLKSLIMFVWETGAATRHQLGNLAPLCNSKDENEDFFECFLGIKLKQRQRCLKNLRQRLEQGEFAHSLKTVEHVLIPMVEYLVFGGAAHQQSRRDTISYDADQKLATLEEGLSIYTAYASQLSWAAYYKLLKKLLAKLSRANTRVNSASRRGQPELEKEKIMTKAICRVLAGFHFAEVEDAIEVLSLRSNEEHEDGQKASTSLWNSDFADLLQKQIGVEGEDQEEDIPADDEEAAADEEDDQELEDEEIAQEGEDEIMEVEEGKTLTAAQVLDIQSKLLEKVLPVLERHLTENDDKHSVRGFVVVCLAKTIRKLPLAAFNNRLQKLVNMIVVQGLRSRDLSHREKARKALVKLVDEVSPRFLSIIFEEMKSQLTRGFQQHVYLFTVHSLLQGLAESKALTPSCITSRMINLNGDILLSELFGELNEEKDNAQNNDLKLIKESKARKAIPIYEIFSEFTDFKSSFMHLLAPIINVLDQNPSFGKVQQCEDLLSRVSSSLMRNQTVGGPTLLLFLYSIIERGVQLAAKVKINDDKEERDYGASRTLVIHKRTREEYKEINMKVEMFWKKGHQTIDSKRTQEISGRVLAFFGLQCFKKALKNKEIIISETREDEGSQLSPERDQRLKEMVTRLDPFVPLILNSFKTYHNPIIVSALHIMTQIVGLGLPSFKELLRKFLNRIFKLFEQTQSSDSDFINSLFRCTSELIKTYAIYQDLSDVQIKTLVQIIRTHIPKFAVQSNALQCLRSVIHRRFVCADLYDLIEQVQEMMVFNTLSSIRGMCSSIFIQFLLDYPLENDRIEEHLNFVLKNLACKRMEGRLQLLEILKTLIERLPKNVVDLYCELLFFTLLLRAVNDEHTECRVKVQQVMRSLVFSNKVSQSKVKTLLNTVLQMGSAEESKRELLQLAKLNALQLLAEGGVNQSHKLKTQEIGQILNSAFQDGIADEISSLQRKVDQVSKTVKQEAGVQEEEEADAQMKNFLRAIQLLDDEASDQGQAEDVADEVDPESQSNEKQWTLLYHALSCVEKVLENQDKKAAVAVCTSLGLPKHLLLFVQYHQSYWVRLICQRLLGHMFSNQRESKGDLILMLGLDVPEQLVDFTYCLINCLNKPVSSEDMKNQIIKNLIFLVSALNSNQLAGLPVEIDKLFRKISYIGRKAMLDIRTSKDQLETILQFFNVSFELQTGQAGADFKRLVCGPILELVYRTYTDEQYAKGSTIKDLSLEIVDSLQRDLDKPFFIETYNSVKTSILKKRLDRKLKQKQLVATEEGLAMRQNKRMRKQHKKKEKKQHQVFLDKN